MMIALSIKVNIDCNITYNKRLVTIVKIYAYCESNLLIPIIKRTIEAL